MHVTVEFGRDTSPTELSAIIALCLAMGGTIPETAFTGTLDVTTAAPFVITPIAPVAPVVPTPPAPPVAAAVVPPPPASNGAAPVSSFERDAKGLPWDERIHAGTRGQNNDGSWKRRKGVDDATVAVVTAELTAAHGVVPNAPPSPVDMASPAPVATAAVDVPTPPAPPVETIVVPPVVPAPPIAAVPTPPAPPAATAGGVITFPALVAKCGQAKGGVGYTYEELDGMARDLGLGMFKDLMTPENAAMRTYFESLIVA